MGKRNFFCAEKQLKYCSACNENISLKKFRVTNPERPSHVTSYYCSICRNCENERAKAFQKIKTMKGIPGKIAKLEFKINQFQKQLKLLKEREIEINPERFT